MEITRGRFKSNSTRLMVKLVNSYDLYHISLHSQDNRVKFFFSDMVSRMI